MGSDAAELAPLIPEQRRELILRVLTHNVMLLAATA